MPPLETIGLEAIFDTKEFVRGQRIYENGLKRVDSSTTRTAQSLTAAWGDSTAGLEDMFARLDAMKGETDEVAAGLANLAAEAAATGTGLSTMAVAAAGVGIALVAVGAVGVAIWRKIGESALEYRNRSERIIEIQERVNEEWDRAAKSLAQSLIPLKVELLEVELKLAEAVTNVIETFKKLVAIAHASIAGIIESLKVIPEAIGAAFRGEELVFEDLWEKMGETGLDKFNEVMSDYIDAFNKTLEEIEEEAEDNWDKVVDAVNNALNRIEDMQIAYARRVADMEADAARRRVRAFDKFQANFQKQSIKGQVALGKIADRYEKRRVKTIANFQKRIDKARAKVSEARIKAAEDFERRERHARERFQLDVLQSERRYQYERSRLVAEGDTLAIEELDARYKIEQEEAKENEALRQRQAGEGQAEQIREAGEAAREQIDELRQQLAETLDEQEANYLDQVEAQKQANITRLVEMTQAFQDRQALQDEDDALALQKAEINYQRQLEDLGRNLARQEELQELGAEEVERLLNRFYGEDGTAERIMKGWHKRENERIMITAALMTQMAKWPELLPGGIPMPGQAVGMDAGGIVVGPQTVQVGAGVVEAFTPLGHIGGGSLDLSWTGGAIPISGLEGASPSDVSAIARELAISLTNKIRVRRRN